MSLGGSIVTAAFTAFFGALVLVIGHLIQRFLIDPIQEQRKTIGEVAYNLTFLANVGSLAHIKHEGERISSAADPLEASTTLRRLGSQLRASLKTIPCYDALASLGCVPKREAIMRGTSGLIGLGNSIWGDGAHSVHIERIAEALDINVKS